MIRFEVNTEALQWRLAVTPQLLMIAEFAALLAADKVRNKPNGLADLLFVFGMEEQDKRQNPFSELSYTTREFRLRQCCYGSEDEGPSQTRYVARWELVQEARAAYQFHNRNAETRFLDTMNESVDVLNASMQQIMRQVRSGEHTKDGIKNLLSILKDAEKVLEGKKKTEKLIGEGLEAMKRRAKAGVESSPLEKGKVSGFLAKFQKGSFEPEQNKLEDES